MLKIVTMSLCIKNLLFIRLSKACILPTKVFVDFTYVFFLRHVFIKKRFPSAVHRIFQPRISKKKLITTKKLSNINVYLSFLPETSFF